MRREHVNANSNHLTGRIISPKYCSLLQKPLFVFLLLLWLPTRAAQVNFCESRAESFPAQDVSSEHSIADNGELLSLTGNTWMRVPFPVTVTSNTILEVEFRSTVQGEVQGIGFETDNYLSPELAFQFYGTQIWSTVQTYNTYSGSGWVKYIIPVGQLIPNGDKCYMLFINDHDVASPTANAEFRKVRVYESGTFSFEGKDLSAYAGQGVQGDVYVLDGGNTLKLTGNRWKKVGYPCTITPDTYLSFDFRSARQGEVHSIGFDTDNTYSDARCFQLYGSQISGPNQEYRDYHLVL